MFKLFFKNTSVNFDYKEIAAVILVTVTKTQPKKTDVKCFEI